MGLLSQTSKFKPAAPNIRVQQVLIDKPKARLQAPSSSSSLSSRAPSTNGKLRLPKASRSSSSSAGAGATASSLHRKSFSPSGDGERAGGYGGSSSRKRKTPRAGAGGTGGARNSPASDVVWEDSDGEEEDWEGALDARKRRRRLHGGRRVDTNRALRDTALGEGASSSAGDGEERQLRLIHGADLASVKLHVKPVEGLGPDEDVAIELQYPGARQRERYELVWERDKIDPVRDVIRVVKNVADVYLTDEEADPFINTTSGLVRKLEKASYKTVLDWPAFKAALQDYNDRVLALQRDGTIAKNLDARHDIPSHLVAFILDQVYDRTVAPYVERLKKYENGSDNVYGELLHPFITNLLVERTQMTSEQVFVDLGSGVGNVALQAALEIGCESWGCEMMDNACDLAEAQEKEFSARCQLWGLKPGKVRLERGDFRSNRPVQEALQRADVVLVNNQAFTSQLNDTLVSMFLDLKPGCKIISLKSFVHDHKSASHNINDVANTILDVEDCTYPEGYVSWTGAGGTFCISTRKKT